MSVQATTWVWDHSTATGSDLLVLLAVADAANAQGGRSCQSVKTIASMSRVATRTVHRSLRKLEDTGQIRRTGIAHEYAGTVIYELPGVILGGPVEAPEPFPNKGGDNLSSPGQGAGGDICDAEGVTSDARGGDTDVTQPQLLSEAPQKDNPRGARAPRTSPTAKRKGMRLPEGWTPAPEVVQQMVEETGADTITLAREHRKFVDWAAAAPDSKGVKLDWNAAWRNWIRRAAEDFARHNTPRQTAVERRVEQNAKVADEWLAKHSTPDAPRNFFEIGQ